MRPSMCALGHLNNANSGIAVTHKVTQTHWHFAVSGI
jgi:hypothetical protein